MFKELKLQLQDTLETKQKEFKVWKQNIHEKYKHQVSAPNMNRVRVVDKEDKDLSKMHMPNSAEAEQQMFMIQIQRAAKTVKLINMLGEFQYDQPECEDFDLPKMGPYLYQEGGYTYHGQYKFGMKHGRGRIFYLNGAEYEGYMCNNQMHGKGRILDIRHVIYEGEIKENTIHGQGTMYVSEKIYFTGEYENGLRNGYGEEHSNISATYKGHYRKEFKWGEGELIFMDGSSLKGVFQANQMTNGTYTIDENTRYQGLMQSQKPNGQGTLFCLENVTVQAEVKPKKKTKLKKGEIAEKVYKDVIKQEVCAITGLWVNGKLQNLEDYPASQIEAVQKVNFDNLHKQCVRHERDQLCLNKQNAELQKREMANEELVVPDEFEERRDIQIIRNPIDLTVKLISSQPVLSPAENKMYQEQKEKSMNSYQSYLSGSRLGLPQLEVSSRFNISGISNIQSRNQTSNYGSYSSYFDKYYVPFTRIDQFRDIDKRIIRHTDKNRAYFDQREDIASIYQTVESRRQSQVSSLVNISPQPRHVHTHGSNDISEIISVAEVDSKTHDLFKDIQMQSSQPRLDLSCQEINQDEKKSKNIPASSELVIEYRANQE